MSLNSLPLIYRLLPSHNISYRLAVVSYRLLLVSYQPNHLLQFPPVSKCLLPSHNIPTVLSPTRLLPFHLPSPVSLSPVSHLLLRSPAVSRWTALPSMALIFSSLPTERHGTTKAQPRRTQGAQRRLRRRRASGTFSLLAVCSRSLPGMRHRRGADAREAAAWRGRGRENGRRRGAGAEVRAGAFQAGECRCRSRSRGNGGADL